jgi:hypothetical protein
MTHLGVKVPPLIKEVPRAYAILASAIWLLVSLPFFYLAYLYWNWPQSLFIQWRGWVFALAALGCVVMATIVPAKYRLGVVGTKVLGWGRFT